MGSQVLSAALESFLRGRRSRVRITTGILAKPCQISTFRKASIVVFAPVTDTPVVAFLPGHGVTMWLASRVQPYKHDAKYQTGMHSALPAAGVVYS